MPLGMEVGLSPGDFVLDGDPAPPLQKGGGDPKFSAHVYCGHGRPSQLLLSSCCVILLTNQQTLVKTLPPPNYGGGR